MLANGGNISPGAADLIAPLVIMLKLTILMVHILADKVEVAAHSDSSNVPEPRIPTFRCYANAPPAASLNCTAEQKCQFKSSRSL